QGAGRPRRHQALGRRDDPDGRDADARGPRRVQSALSHLEGRVLARQARRDGHRAVQGVVPSLCPERGAHAPHREHLRREQPPHRGKLLQGRRARAAPSRRARPEEARPGALDQGHARKEPLIMRIYTVFLRKAADPLFTPDLDAVFVREGFNWAAFFFTWIWALVNRLWIAAALLFAGDVAIALAFELVAFDTNSQFWSTLAWHL